MTEPIKNSLDKRPFGCRIILDLQRAFDAINHSILLDLLEHYGICGIALTDRKIFVLVNGHNSSQLNVTCGVPQTLCLVPVGRVCLILRLADLFQLKLLRFLYRYVNKTALFYFLSFFQSVSPVFQCGTRQASNKDIF